MYWLYLSQHLNPVVSAMPTRCVLDMSIFCFVHIIQSPVNPTCMVFGSKDLFCIFPFFFIPPVPPCLECSGAVRYCSFPLPKIPTVPKFPVYVCKPFFLLCSDCSSPPHSFPRPCSTLNIPPQVSLTHFSGPFLSNKTIHAHTHKKNG